MRIDADSKHFPKNSVFFKFDLTKRQAQLTMFDVFLIKKQISATKTNVWIFNCVGIIITCEIPCI
jgi:hypothetical protein